VVAYHMETSHTAKITLIISYLVKQYLKFDKLQILRLLPALSTICVAIFASGCGSIHSDVSISPPFQGHSLGKTD
jgi:hypothetical protein